MGMFGRLRQTLAVEPVNTGRQLEMDIAKAQMVLMLPFIHVIIECTSDEGLCSGIPYLFDSIIGGPFSAPMYLFALGIGIDYSRKVTVSQQLTRGIKLVGIFYLSNTCRFLVPYLIGYGISGDREQFIEPLMYRWLGSDVLLFAGMAVIVIAAFRYFKLSARSMIVISLALTAAADIIGDVDTHSKYGNIFLGYLIGTDDATGLVISDFPLLIWLIFPVCGCVFGRVLLHVADKKTFYRIISPIAMIVPLVYFPIGIHYGWGMFGEGQNCYYHMMIWDVAVCLCLDIGMLGLWYNLSRYMGKRTRAFFTEVSRNITAIYCIHWVFVRTITNVILYIVNGTQELPVWQSLLLALAILIVSFYLARWYKMQKALFKRRRARASEGTYKG